MISLTLQVGKDFKITIKVPANVVVVVLAMLA